jgi:hypothetical protein
MAEGTDASMAAIIGEEYVRIYDRVSGNKEASEGYIKEASEGYMWWMGEFLQHNYAKNRIQAKEFLEHLSKSRANPGGDDTTSAIGDWLIERFLAGDSAEYCAERMVYDATADKLDAYITNSEWNAARPGPGDGQNRSNVIWPLERF